MLHKLWIEERETHELRLIQIHHKEFVRRGQVRFFRGELFVKIAYIFRVFLKA